MGDSVPSASWVAIFGSLIGLIGTLAGIAANWLKEGNPTSQRLRAFEEAIKEMEFWETRLRIQTLVLEPDNLQSAREETMKKAEQIRLSLESALAEISEPRDISSVARSAFGTSSRPTRQSTPQRGMLRRFLLFYRPQKTISIIPRLFYWLALMWAVASALVTYFDIKEHNAYAPGTAGQWTWDFIIALGPVVLFYLISLWLDKSDDRHI